MTRFDASSTHTRSTSPVALTEIEARKCGLSVATLRAWRHRGRGRGSCDSDGRSGTCRPTWTTFIRASAVDTRSVSRQMEIENRGVAGMSLWKRGRQYWTDFAVAGKRYRKRLGTTNLQVAKRRERELLEGAGRGAARGHEQGPKRLSAAIEVVPRRQADALLATDDRARGGAPESRQADTSATCRSPRSRRRRSPGFQRARHEAGIGNRTINMDVGVLSRVLKSCGRWRALADHVHNLPERQHPVGRALTGEERRGCSPPPRRIRNGSTCTAPRSSRRTRRCVQSRSSTSADATSIWSRSSLYVRRSKNETSHRVIPLNTSASMRSRECSSEPTCSVTPSPSTISGRRASGDASTRRSRC